MYECNYDVTQNNILVMLPANESWNGVESFLVNISSTPFWLSVNNIMFLPMFIL